MASQLDLGSARRSAVELSRTRLATLEAGDPAAPPVLLVPGFTGSKEDFGPILDAVADAGLRPVAIDLPGQFESPGLPEPSDHGPAVLGALVLQACRLLGGGVRLLGHSYGGFVTRSAVIDAAAVDDRSAIASLVLMDSGAEHIRGERADTIGLLAPVLDDGGLEVVYAGSQAAARARGDYQEPSPELEAFLRKRFMANDETMLRGMSAALLSEPDRVDELHAALDQLNLPALVVYGADEDVWSAGEIAAMAERLGVPGLSVPDAAHSPAVDNPAATVAVLLEFWLAS